MNSLVWNDQPHIENKQSFSRIKCDRFINRNVRLLAPHIHVDSHKLYSIKQINSFSIFYIDVAVAAAAVEAAFFFSAFSELCVFGVQAT